jgi:REP element-mobilizing transposase RayT
VSKRRSKIVLHRRRPEITRRTPGHVTLRVHRDLAGLRTKRRVGVIRGAIAALCTRGGLRVIDWSIQGNHMHLVIEADDNAALSRGMQGLCVRIAHGLNRLAGRKGAVFTERYHLRLLRTPAEVRNARTYVLNNYRRHAAQSGRSVEPGWVDRFSS